MNWSSMTMRRGLGFHATKKLVNNLTKSSGFHWCGWARYPFYLRRFCWAHVGTFEKLSLSTPGLCWHKDPG